MNKPVLHSEARTIEELVPIPSWAKHDPAPPLLGPSLEDFTDQGVLRLLHDTQLSLIEPGVTFHIRAIQQILTRAGAERAANLAIEFDPSTDRLSIHAIRVHRADQFIEHARPGAMDLLRRESELERLALNGRLTASFVVPDLREGDQLEICFTHYSNLSATQGRYAGWLVFNSYAPWLETRVVVIRPRSTRPVTLKGFNSPPAAVSETKDDVEVLRCSLRTQQRLAVEPLTPSWTVKSPCYQVTEFASWNEVANLFACHYQDTAVPPEVASACEALAAASSDPASLAVDWLRFVQRSLRYFAFSFGDGNVVPRELETIWQRRFGDCKDAARLYVAGARRLGLDACAALVSTSHGLSLEDFAPAAQVFNHVIVRLRIGRETYWLDPTLPSQTGSLSQLQLRHAGFALPLRDDTTTLESMPQSQIVDVLHCEDEISLGPKPDSPAQLHRRMVFAHWVADNARHRIANDGANKLATLLLQDLTAAWPRAVSVMDPVFEEDAGTNRLILRCAYSVPQPWVATDGKRLQLALVDTVTNKELSNLNGAGRQGPILLGNPRRVSWRAVVNMPRRWHGKGWNNVVDEPGLHFVSTFDVGRRQAVIEHVLTIDSWSIAAEHAAAYNRVFTKANANLTRVFARTLFGRITPPTGPVRWMLGNRWRRLGLFVVLLILYAAIRSLLV